ncbi:MAG: DsbA family protein [Saprospiraceae bacterium]
MNKPKIIYFFDTLCGWCYGFSPVIKKIAEKYHNEFDFEVISGGMVMGERVQPASVMADYILKAYKSLENRTGVKFGEPFLDMLRDGTRIQSSLEPALVMTTFKYYQPKNAIAFAHDLQKLNYVEGANLNDFDSYKDLIESYDLDWQSFKKELQTELIRKTTNSDFALSKAYQVSGFPTVFFENDTVRSAISRGYQPFEQLDDIMQQVLEYQQREMAKR